MNKLTIQPADFLDRLSILMLHRLRGDLKGTFTEFSAFMNVIELTDPTLREFILLLDVNREIWDLESDIRRGKDGELGLEEIGRRALAIRDLNRTRVSIKNRVSENQGGFAHVKVDHISE